MFRHGLTILKDRECDFHETLVRFRHKMLATACDNSRAISAQSRSHGGDRKSGLRGGERCCGSRHTGIAHRFKEYLHASGLSRLGQLVLQWFGEIRARITKAH